MLHVLISHIQRKARWSAPSLSVCAVLVGLFVLSACTGVALPPPVAQMATAPTSQPVVEAVGPDVDRIGFPAGYRENMQVYYEFDRPDNRSARVIYANALAAGVRPGENFPYGSELVMEVYRTKRDDAGNVLLDENGRYTRDELAGLFVMRKEQGFGSKYGELRNGEWEYVAYRSDGTFQTPPERTGACAACHMEVGYGKDWVFGAHRAAPQEAALPAENTVILVDYAFLPSVITVTVGTELRWTNHDVVFHSVLAEDHSFNSGLLRLQGSNARKFEEEGTFNYFCPLHNNMKGTVVVVK